MTREEAIKIIDCYDINFYDLSGEKIPAYKLAEAFDMAIEALQFMEHFDLLKEYQSLQEVVQCKDCKWYDNRDVCHNPRYGDGHANYSPPYVDEEYWCRDGEREEP